MMQFYSYEQIKAAGDCRRFVQEVLGAEINREGRCQAIWRGGDGWNVKINEKEWYDFVKKHGGSIIELCAESKFNGDVQLAQQFLGEWLGLEPQFGLAKNPLKDRGTLYERLVNEGYSETKRYLYEDLEGKVIHHVSRMEHDTKHKEFVQGTPQHWGLGDTVPILYRMKDWVASTYVCIVEGEKDVDTLIDQLGIPATTNCGGADKWRPEYAQYFEGKNVAIIRDNDEAGQKHAGRVSGELKNAAAKMVIICPSQLDKGDVTDWVEKEGGNREALMTMVKSASPLNKEEIQAPDLALIEAKKANQRELCNYWLEKKQIGNESKVVRVARPLGGIIKEIHSRFLGFPCRVGSSEVLFDHDRDTGNIMRIRRASQLFAWMNRKSKKVVSWAKGDDFATKDELLAGLMEEAHVYEGISEVPEFPKRSDIYYTHPPLPESSENLKYLNGLCEFWRPATNADRLLIVAFFCAGLWYRPETNKPLWLIDANSRGAGKTKLVAAAAMLFYGEQFEIDKVYLLNKPEEIMKNLLSTEGRDARFVLFDNAEGLIKSPILAKLVTQRSITGRPAYGAGMETRPNNLNYCITSNSATLDDDLSVRAFIINLLKPDNYNPNWDEDRDAYIIRYRPHIIADILAILESPNEFDAPTHTRFSMFERHVLQKVCRNEIEYEEVIQGIITSRDEVNVDNEMAGLLEDIIRERLLQVDGILPGQDNVFIHTQVFSKWLRWANESEIDTQQGISKQDVHNFSKNGHTKFLRDKPNRAWLNGHGSKQIRGFYWEANPGSKERKIIIPGTGENRAPRVYL